LQQAAVEEKERIHGGQIWAVVIAGIIFGSITAILRPRGVRVCATACLYVASLVAISLAMCEVTRKPLHYRYPAFVTFLHYVCTWVICTGYWAWRREPEKCLPTSLGSMKLYFVRMVPIALSLPISIVLNNKALTFIGAGLAAIVGTLSPICTAVLSRVFGRRMTPISWFGVLVAFLGALWAGCSELTTILRRETEANAQAQIQGLSWAVGALAFRSIRVVLQDSLMSPKAYGEAPAGPAASAPSPRAPAEQRNCEDAPEGARQKSRGALEPQTEREADISGLHLIALQSPAVVCVSAIFMFATENVGDALHALTVPVFRMLVVTIVIAVCLNCVGATILKELGSTSMQIIGKLNTVVTTAVSMAFFHESLPIAVLCGSAVVLVGVAIFELGEKTSQWPFSEGSKVK